MKMIALFISSTKGQGIYFCCIKQIEDRKLHQKCFQD